MLKIFKNGYEINEIKSIILLYCQQKMNSDSEYELFSIT